MVAGQLKAPRATPCPTFVGADHALGLTVVGVVDADWWPVVLVGDAGAVVVAPTWLSALPEHAAVMSAVATRTAPSPTAVGLRPDGVIRTQPNVQHLCSVTAPGREDHIRAFFQLVSPC